MRQCRKEGTASNEEVRHGERKNLELSHSCHQETNSDLLSSMGVLHHQLSALTVQHNTRDLCGSAEAIVRGEEHSIKHMKYMH